MVMVPAVSRQPSLPQLVPEESDVRRKGVANHHQLVLGRIRVSNVIG